MGVGLPNFAMDSTMHMVVQVHLKMVASSPWSNEPTTTRKSFIYRICLKCIALNSAMIILLIKKFNKMVMEERIVRERERERGRVSWEKGSPSNLYRKSGV